MTTATRPVHCPGCIGYEPERKGGYSIANPGYCAGLDLETERAAWRALVRELLQELIANCQDADHGEFHVQQLRDLDAGQIPEAP